MGKAQKNVIKGKLEYRQFIILDDGSELRVRYNQDKSLYDGTDIQVYEYQAYEGSGDTRKEVTRYAVAYDQALRASKKTISDKITSLKASGLSADEILAQLLM